MNKDTIFIIFLFVILIATILLIFNNDKKYDFTIYGFNAGKADSFVLIKDDKVVIIDTGEKELFENIDRYLKNKKISKIDYLIISHFDKDHVGSASSIIDNYEVVNVLQSNYPKDSKVYNKYLTSMKAKNIEPVTVRDNLEFTISNLDFTIIPPQQELYEVDPSNNSSLIVSINYKNSSYLFTGDIENDRIKEFVSNNNINYDFLKFSYHGHYQEEIESFIKNVKPKYTVITSSYEEKEDDEVLGILSKNNVETYLTRKGNVVIKSDGDKIKIAYE